MNNKKQLFIRGDLNALNNGVIPLRNQVWISLLKKEYGSIYDGIKIWLSEDTIKDGKQDPTIFPGVIKNIGREDEYEILVDENDMKYLSESTEFKYYSVEEILGQKYFTEENNN